MFVLLLGVDSPFCSTIFLFKTQWFSLGFLRLSRKKDPLKIFIVRVPQKRRWRIKDWVPALQDLPVLPLPIPFGLRPLNSQDLRQSAKSEMPHKLNDSAPPAVDGCEFHKPHHFETMVEAIVLVGEPSETKVSWVVRDFIHSVFHTKVGWWFACMESTMPIPFPNCSFLPGGPDWWLGG